MGLIFNRLIKFRYYKLSHTCLTNEGGRQRKIWNAAKSTGMLVNEAVNSNTVITGTLVTLQQAANWNKWNGFNECAAVSVFKWEQRWLEKLMMKAQGQNHDIIATRVPLSSRHKREPLMKRYFVLDVQDLSCASFSSPDAPAEELPLRIANRREK